MNKPPAFQFYADDFVAGVAELSQEEVGAYILLLCHQWNRGSIPVEPDRQQNLAKGKVSDHVLKKFKAGDDGLLRNARLEIERAKQDSFRAKQKEKGVLSGAARREQRFNRGSTVVQPRHEPDHQPEGNSPSPSPSPSLVEREREFSETPPMSREDYDALADMRGVGKDCAEWFWNTHDARNWTDATGQPIRKVAPLLLNAWSNWQAKTSQNNATAKPGAARAPFLSELKTVLDTKKAIRNVVARRIPTGPVARVNPKDKEELDRLNKEIGDLMHQIDQQPTAANFKN